MPRSIYFIVSHSSAGGAQEIWANLAEAFRQRGHHVQLFALYPLRETVRETSADLPWRYVVPKRPGGPVALARMIGRLVGILREEKPAMVLTAMPAANVAAALAARLAGGGTEVIVSQHTPAETYHPAMNRLDTWAGSLGSVRAIVSVSNSVSSSLDGKPAGYRLKRRTIPNALPPAIEELVGKLRAGRVDRGRPGRLVVATGRLARQKNYPLLIRAVALLPDVSFAIIGNGPDEAALKALATDLGVADRVRFLGHRPRAEALAILASGDVFAQVSLFEGHSLALIEAAKIGLPLVVSDVPVQIEGITRRDGQRCGIAVSTGDAEGLAQAIRSLLDDPAAHALWAARAEALGGEATFEAMVTAYEELSR
jgi:glycosyltransferase involved in cell wall biosynthesis